MSRSPRADAKTLLTFVADAQASEGRVPFTTELLDRLAAVMQCHFATYYELDLLSRVVIDYVPCSDEPSYGATPASEWRDDDDQREISAHARSDIGRDQVAMWSDTKDRAARRRFEWNYSASVFEVVDCVWTVFGTGRFERAALALHRRDRDFTERDRWNVLALRPHVSALIRDSRARRRLDSLMSAIDSADDAEPRGLLCVGARLDIEHESPAARRILRSWFGTRDARLPTDIVDWLHSGSGREPLRIQRGDTRLLVEAPSDGALVLTEEAVPPTSLTARETDVLRCLAAGKSTAEIARLLWVTPATVSKHLENIYRKLGVTSRTAALAAVGSLTSVRR